MSLCIRLAGITDADTIHAITQDAWDEYRHVPGGSSALNETPSIIRSSLQGCNMYAALGFLKAEPITAVRFEMTEQHLYFSRLAVRRRNQGQGYARIMLRWLENLAKQQELDEILCTVRAS